MSETTTIAETGTIAYDTITTSGTYILTAAGGMGGTSGQAFAGGEGAIVVGTFFLSAGTTLEIVAGSAGESEPLSTGTGAGGGGGSFIYDENTGVLLEAAGGGGGGGETTGTGINASANTAGTAGNGKYGGQGGTNGSGGVPAPYLNGYLGGGGGGIDSAGGTSSSRNSGGGGSGGSLTNAQGPETEVTLPTVGGAGVTFSVGNVISGVGGFGGGGGGGENGGGGGGGYSGGGGGLYGGGGGGSFLARSATNITDLLTTNNFALNTAPNGEVLISLACFAAGMRILLEDGECPVEAIKPGDRAITHSGQAVHIDWVGKRHIDLTRHAHPELAQPVLISAGALADGIPVRDLIVSQDHALYFENILVPAKVLINGHSIRLLNLAHVTYYHIELANHDIIFAEGAPAETYLDTGNRDAFEGGASLQLHPDFAQTMRERNSCAPLLEAGEAVEAIRARLLARSGLAANDEHGMVVEYVEGGAIIRSKTAVPGWHTADPRDLRRLGVKVAALSVGDKKIALDDPALVAGWHALEQEGRWTDGAAFVPAELLNGGVLTVELAPVGLRYPVVAAQK